MAIDDKKLVDIYLGRIRESKKLLEVNKKDIVKYYQVRASNGIAIGSNRYPLFVLLRLGETLDKPFREATSDDLMAFFNELKPLSNNGKSMDAYAPKTVWTYKAAVKTFWKWLYGFNKKSRECPKAVDWIERNAKVAKTHVPKDVLTKDEVNEMIRVAKHPRDKALVAVLFDTGMRCGELLNMRKSQAKPYDDYVEFEANGKTGPRECIAVESAPHLRKYLQWLDENPQFPRKGYQDHVWLNLNRGWFACYSETNGRNALAEKGTALSRDGVGQVLKRIALKAGIKKKVWTHLLRHSSATYWAQFMNESEMRIKFGWSRESPMPSNYINFDYNRVKEKQLKKAGKWTEPDTNEKQMFKVRDCPFCQTNNPADAEYCLKCGKPLDAKLLKQNEQTAKTLTLMQEVLGQLHGLEKQGFDIQKFNEFMQGWTTKKQ